MLRAVCTPLGMPKVLETEGFSGSLVLILSGLLEGLSSASPVPSPEQTQGWAFRVCLGQGLGAKTASKSRDQEESSDCSVCPFLVPPPPPAPPPSVSGHSKQLNSPPLPWILY